MTAPRMALTSEQADVDVLALDVPAELAYVFSKIHGTYVSHNRFVKAVVALEFMRCICFSGAFCGVDCVDTRMLS